MKQVSISKKDDELYKQNNNTKLFTEALGIQINYHDYNLNILDFSP